MNERIKELAEQAGYKPLPGFDFANSLQEVFMKKFAELLIQETINELSKQMYWHEIDFSNCPKFYTAIERTERYFGIEE